MSHLIPESLSHFAYSKSFVYGQARVVFYIMMSIAESEDAQRRGMILVGNNCRPNGPDPDAVESHNFLFAMLDAFPVRIECHHYLLRNQHREIHAGIKKGLDASSQRNRVRFKYYYGCNEDFKLPLMSVGIPVSVLPFDEDDEKEMNYHQEWLQARRAKEIVHLQTSHSQHINEDSVITDEEPSTEIGDVGTKNDSIIAPRPIDILLGRSYYSMKHVGNARFRKILDDNYSVYESTSKNEKTAVAEKIVNDILSGGARFLRQGEHGWEEASFLEARNKVSNGYRDRRKKIAAAKVEESK